MNYYDNAEAYHNRGIDWDLFACLEDNPQAFAVDDIERVLAVREGEPDYGDWAWVLRLKDGRCAYLQGGCGYTGWDCQSWAWSQFAATPEEAAGLCFSEFYGGWGPATTTHLLAQLAEGKAATWRERKDREFGLE
jgi:RimJ/RimL family protein N-acetyltransferase